MKGYLEGGVPEMAPGLELPKEWNVLLLLLRFLGRRTGERFAETAPGLTAALAEGAVSAGVLLGYGLFFHVVYYSARAAMA
jgi:hypothetical protein